MAQSASSNIVGVHYKVGKKIGEGSFGIIFEGINILNNQQVAIKFEPRKCEAPQLRDEYRSYRILNNSVGIPQAYFFGQEGVHNILIIDLLGPSLEDLFDWCNRKFTVKTVVQVAKQMIQRVETIHEHNLIYRDIKPDNFLIGKPGTSYANQVYIVDFGMAKQYRDPKTKLHIPYREKKALSGTARYMSINTHLGREQSRRDDLESLGHVFMYFLRGSLPWQGLKAPTNKQKYEKIGLKKQTTSINELCYGFPIQFAQYLTYVRNLKFDETPDYNYLVSLMDKALTSLGAEEDGHYDWMDLNGGRGWDAALNKKANLHGYGNPHPPQHRRQQQATATSQSPNQIQLPQQLQQSQQQIQQSTPLHQRNDSVNSKLLSLSQRNARNSRSKSLSFGNYNSITQDNRNHQFLNSGNSPVMPNMNANNGSYNNQTQAYQQQHGMIPVRDDGDLHSDTSSFNERRKKGRGCLHGLFCCCF
ncbi:casein kinase I [Scheffersomyces xylosifermentans]|uniref:casein kinase I n=1 Tax=Scheffersomyces xylosifermentans TaxID=1304137 RepID=UPI00315D6E75